MTSAVHTGWAAAQGRRFEWAPNRSMPADPQAVGEHLLRLQEAGDCSPAAIVESARPKDSPIHGLFEWDLERAATRDWMATARKIPRSLVEIQQVDEDREVRTVTPAFVHVPPEEGCGQGQYLEPAILSEDQARRALRQMQQQLKALEWATAAVSAVLSARDPDFVRDLREAVAGVREVAFRG